MSNNKIIVLCGSSGSGKDALQWALNKQLGYNVIVSITTRPKRLGEMDGVNYHYADLATFEEMIRNNELVEYRYYETLVGGVPAKWYYGCAFSDVPCDKNSVIVLDPVGLRGFKEHYGDRVVSFFLDSPEPLRQDRAKRRGSFDETEWNRRVADDQKIFSFEFIYDEIDFQLSNSIKTEINDLVYDVLNCLSSPRESIMIEYNLKLVHYTIKHYKLEFLDDYDDIYQVGCIGLINAVRAFDKSRGVKFSTYAVTCIHNAIISHYGSASRRNDLMKTAISLDAPLNGLTENTLHDTLTSDQFDIQETINQEVAKKFISDLLNEIEPPQLREMVRLHYIENVSFRQLGRTYAISHEWARKQINKAVQSTSVAKELID